MNPKDNNQANPTPTEEFQPTPPNSTEAVKPGLQTPLQPIVTPTPLPPPQPSPSNSDAKKKLIIAAVILFVVVALGLAAWFVFGSNSDSTDASLENTVSTVDIVETASTNTIVEWVNIQDLSGESNWDSGQTSGASTVFSHKTNSCTTTIQLASGIEDLGVASQAADADRLLQQVRTQSASVKVEIDEQLTFQGGSDPVNPDKEYIFDGKTLGFVGLDGKNYTVSLLAYWHNDRAMYVTTSCEEDDWFSSSADVAAMYFSLRVFEQES